MAAAEAEAAGEGEAAGEAEAAGAEAAAGGAEGREAEAAEKTEEPRCYGRVKSYNYGKGFGFLECPQLGARFDRDVFLRKEAVQEEVLLGRIASGCGPKAAVQRGDIFVSFALAVNEAGHPEARDVHEVRRADIPEELLEGFPAATAKATPPAKPAGRKGGEAVGQASEGSEQLAAESKKRASKSGSKEETEQGLLVGSYRCRVGKNAEDNWNLLRAAKNKHWFFHLTDDPSPYVVLECEREPGEEEKRRCAEICRASSKMKLSGSVKVDATPCGNVSFGKRGDEVGECSYKKDKLVEIITVT